MPEPTKTIRTADGVSLSEGDNAFNYYDHKPGRIARIDHFAQPDPANGQTSSTPIKEWTNYWFDFEHTDGSNTKAYLDGSRICSVTHARNKGWLR